MDIHRMMVENKGKDILDFHKQQKDKEEAEAELQN